MSKYQLIVKELTAINEAKFQEICNAFLMTEYFGDLHSPGSVEGKEKTKKGKPDSFIILPDKRYMLCEFTTKDSANKSSFNNKLEGDLGNCLNFGALQIKKEKVAGIVLCCNSIVDLEESEKLNEICFPFDIPLRIVGITSLAMFLFTKGKYLARELLNIPFDSGLMLTKEQFLNLHSRNKGATPLTNRLLGRESEIMNIVNSLENEDIVVLKGAPGVGKSRIALEVVDEFLKKHVDFQPYYILPRSGSIVDDLVTHLDGANNYILFIDDANRQIVNFLTLLNSQLETEDRQIKILLTVRDYALQDILDVSKNTDPVIFPIEQLNRDIIIQILAAYPFSIRQQALLERIANICKGNARIAIMASMVVKENQDLTQLKNISQIYDEYFQGILADKEILQDENTLKILGILAFYYSIDIEDEYEENIFKHFGIAFPIFLETVNLLEDLEIVEVYQKFTVKITEQVLSTYLFYKIFIKDRIIPFSKLLKKNSGSYHRRMRDNLDPAIEAFGESSVIDPIKDELLTYWRTVNNLPEPAYRFLEIFGLYFPSQAFGFLLREIKIIPDISEVNSDEMFYKINSYYFINDTILRILESFIKSRETRNLIASVELALLYTSKKPEQFELLKRITKEQLSIQVQDIEDGCIRQNVIFDFLLRNINGLIVYRHFFYRIFNELIISLHLPRDVYEKIGDKYFLKEPVKQLRNKYLEFFVNTYDKNSLLSRPVLDSYIENIQFSTTLLLSLDEPFLLDIFNKYLNPKCFSDCYLIRSYIIETKRKGYQSESIYELNVRFTNETFQIGMVLIYDRYKQMETNSRPGELHKFDEIRKTEMQNNLVLTTFSDFKIIYKAMSEIMDEKLGASLNLADPADRLIALIFEKNILLGFRVLNFYLKEGNKALFRPVKLYITIFSAGIKSIQKLFRIINHSNYKMKDDWLERYFIHIPEVHITRNIISHLFAFYEMRKTEVDLYAGTLDRYIPYDEKIYEKILHILVEKRNQNESYKYKLGYRFFKDNTAIIKNNTALCQTAYLQQNQMTNQYDSDCNDLLEILLFQPEFLYQYIDILYAKSRSTLTADNKILSNLWVLENIDEMIYNIIIKGRFLAGYSIGDHFFNLFFINLDDKYIERAYILLKKLIEDFNTDPIILNIVFDIARNSIHVYLAELIRYFLTLNSDFKIFMHLNWLNNHFSSNGNQIWSDFRANELTKIYEIIKSLPEPLKYIMHSEEFEQRINYEQMDSSRERKLQFRNLR